MDQLKPIIQWCQRNVFWIGCFLLSAAMIGSWIFSSMQLAAVQEKRQREIDKHVSALKKVSGTTAEKDLDAKAHANKSTQEGMDAEIDRTIDSIVRAWQKRYDEQQTLLQWPEGEMELESGTKVPLLSKQTCNFFSRIDVPEKVTELGKGFEKFRKDFYDKVPNFMIKVCRDIDINWKYDKLRIAEERKKQKEELEDGDGNSGFAGGMGGGRNGSGGGGGMGGFGSNDDTTYLDEINRYAVNWSDENQALWNQKLTEFQGRDDHNDAVLYPTYMQANMLMQDLWLLEAMFNNIKEINGGSRSNDTSTIRTLDHVVFGREVGSKLGKLSQIDDRLGATEATPDPLGEGMMGGMQNPGEYEGGFYSGGDPSGMETTAGTGSAYGLRYVNPNLEAISAEDVRAVLGGAALPETNLELIVAKRVPFRLALKMDERKINEFIAICANSEFVFEINQLRVNRHEDFPGKIEFNGGSVGAGIGSTEGMELNISSGGSGAASEPSANLVPKPVESRQDFMVSVEFYGIVKIYNPVRENFLRLAAGQDVVDETHDPNMEAADAAVPAAQPTAQPTATGDLPAAVQPSVTPEGDLAAPPAATPDTGAPAAAQPAAAQTPAAGDGQ